ncbi:hypothetical protein BASA60_004578 [Batrachochytrium salamandrivorans]|nr:hypothetical protein BASA62_009273 [Batrachochytrium salamandrivorans]KAH6576306.1 hypothetical protein BASA60_004578 [Batrachochytrium salamandrivorans]KAH9272569.1 hypothetical protein BASA83_005069 [Batrachochytrium salamandrivorans]
MRVNVLFVAAMVITSVNAGRRKKGADQPKHHDGSKTSKGPFGLTVRPLYLALPPTSSESGPSPVLPSTSPDDELSPALSPTSPDDELSLVFLPTSSESDEDEPQESDPPKEDPVCDSIVKELEVLLGKAYILDLTIQTQMPILSNIIKEEGGSSASKIKKVEDWFKSHPEDKDTIEEMRNEHTDLMEKYYEAWGRFSGSGCLVEKFVELSPVKNDNKWLLFSVTRGDYSSTGHYESDSDISEKQ